MRISDWSSDVCSSDLKGTTPAELERTINSNVRALPGSFETSDDVLGGIRSIVKFGRADDYYEKLPATYEAMTAAEIDAAARKALSVDDLVYVVVGHAATVKKSGRTSCRERWGQ